MLRLLPALLFLLITTRSSAQNTEALNERNGFKDIKLGSLIDSIPEAKLKKEFTIEGNVYPSALYEVKVDGSPYAHIGDIEVHSITLKTYRQKIYEIDIITDKDPRLMEAMENVYGKTTWDKSKNRYFWKSDQLILMYSTYGKKDKELELLYKSFLVPKDMEKDKEKKIDNIADDF